MNKYLFNLFIFFFFAINILSSNKPNLKTNAQWKNKTALLTKQIFIQEENSNYYSYNIYSVKGKIQISILNYDLTTQKLIFQKTNQLFFRSAYQNYIIVQEKRYTRSISYYVLQITRAKKGFKLQAQTVNSKFDSQGFQFNDTYLLTSIIQYNKQKSIIYVTMESATDFDVYQINLKRKYNNKMVIVNWFYFNKNRKQKIIGGNSHVLVQKTNDKLWIDTNNPLYNFTTQTIYEKINIQQIKSLRIYINGSYAFNLAASYFQYVSISKDYLCMSAFVYNGYDKQPVQGAGSLSSNKKPIKFYSDGYSYFVAVADNDIYYTTVWWNEKIKDYSIYSSTLKKTVKDFKKWGQYIKSFSEALMIILYDEKFYILTQEWFYVQNGIYFDKMKVTEVITEKTNLQQLQFQYMQKYISKSKNKKY